MEKLSKLAAWMTNGPKRETLRSKSAHVREVVSIFEKRLRETGSDIDLNIAQELDRIKKRASDIAKMSILDSLVNTMEFKNQEENVGNIRDALKIMLKPDGVVKNTGSESPEPQMAGANPFFESIPLDQGQRDSFVGRQSNHPNETISKLVPSMHSATSVAGGVAAQGTAIKDQTSQLPHQASIVVMPKYAKNPDGSPNFFKELDAPDPALYIALGFDSKAKTGVKHYRKFFSQPLEETDFTSNYSFKPCQIHRGKKIVSENKSWVKRLFFKDDPYREVGQFNGSFDLIEEDLLRLVQSLKLSPELLRMFSLPSNPEEWRHDRLDKSILNEAKVIVRLYIVDAEISEDTDMGSDPDPYLQISLGKDTIDVPSC